ncbi:hypothetical protein FBU30_004189 [Linnemannia zychae]|nr:hypothetical protein FBU30_004189 [Linnemannia zychae]
MGLPSKKLDLSKSVIPTTIIKTRHIHRPHPSCSTQPFVFHLQQQYQQHVQQQLRQDQQDLDEARGRSGSIEMGFQRKRSLSVPLLFSLNSGGLENDIHTQDRRQNQGQSGQDPDGDQDMDTDEVASPTSSAMATASGLSQGSNNNPSPSTALVYDYSKMTLQRESLLATLPRSHRHRAYASSIAKGPQPSSHSRHTLYYSGNNHPHAFYRNQYNPFTNRKFPPYQYWAVSAQRDYHLSTIGVLASPSGVRSGAISSSSSSSAPGSGGEGGTGDLFLRAALGGSGGGVNKSVYRSRLPVHLRHITSRNNRRPAVCLSAFPSGEGRDEGNIDNSRDMKRHSTSILPSSSSSETSTGRASSMTLLVPGTDQRSPFQVSHTSSTSSSLSSSSSEPESTSISPSKTAARERGDSSPSSLGRESLSAANRKKLSDWKRATALSFDQDSDPQRTGMVMRLASNDPSSITTTSSASSSSAVLRGNSSAGRQWLSQRGGLANLFQNNLSIHGSGSSEGGSGSGPSGSTVDRLVEEMTKWSV